MIETKTVWSTITELDDGIFDKDILEELIIKSEIPFFKGTKVKISLEVVK